MSTLDAYLAWLTCERCTCLWRWGSYGRLQGVSMGDGWIRTTTDPDCPHHGDRP